MMPRSTDESGVNEPGSNPEAKPIAPLLVRFCPILEIPTRTHTKEHCWLEETSSKRDCCCYARRAEVASGNHAGRLGGPTWPGDQGEVRAITHNGEYAKAAAFFLFSCIGFHWPARLYLGGMLPRDFLPDFATFNPRSAQHGARPGPTRAPWGRRGPCVPRSRERQKGPVAGGKIVVDVQKKVNLVRMQTYGSGKLPVCIGTC